MAIRLHQDGALEILQRRCLRGQTPYGTEWKVYFSYDKPDLCANKKAGRTGLKWVNAQGLLLPADQAVVLFAPAQQSKLPEQTIIFSESILGIGLQAAVDTD